MEEPSICELPEDLILKIFSLLPLYKESTATHLLRKLRMEGPWKLVPDVMFDDDDESYASFVTFMNFVYGSLLFNNDQILERLHLILNQDYSASDINIWLKLAVKRSVRKLRIQTFGKTLELPRCLSICVTLKSLVLHKVRIKVVPPCFRLPSLKSLHLFSVQFSGDVSLASLLQSCPHLEYLVVWDVVVDTFPPCFLFSSLKSLHLLSTYFSEEDGSVASLLRICPVLEDLFVKRTCRIFNNYVPHTCRTLKTLILRDLIIGSVPPLFCLPSLKTMHLLSVTFSGGESVATLLQICPLLEDLVVKQTEVSDSEDTTKECTLSCRTLQTLTLSELSIKMYLPWFRFPLLKTLHLLSVKFPNYESLAGFLPICPLLEYLLVDQTKDDSLIFENVQPWFYLPSLKSLHLISAKFWGDESFADLIRRCPVLEDLVINKTIDDNVMIFDIDAPSLKSLSIDNSKGKRACVKEEARGFVINAPSLEKINFKDTFSNFLEFEHMPEVTEANIQVICSQSTKFIGSFTSIRHLSLCSLSSETPYPRGTTFPYLEHLELCTCSAGWANLLVCILNDSPRLKHLKLKSQHRAHYNDPMIHWNKPRTVPECLSTHLEIMEWRQYEGTEQERNVADYMLANATSLKMATFSTRCRNKHHRMLKKLKKLHRVSQTCQLLFD